MWIARMSKKTLVILGAAILLFAAPASAAIAFVQKGAFSIVSGTSATVSVTISAVGNGNLVAGVVFWGTGANDLTSVDDGNGNTATIVETQLNIQADGRSAASFYFKNVTSGATVITANFTNTPEYNKIAVHEISGADTTAPLDQNVSNSQAAPGAGANAVTSTAKTTTANGEYIFGGSVSAFASVSAQQYSLGTNFLNLADSFSSGNIGEIAAEGLVQGTAGSIAATFTNTNGAGDDFATFLMTFKAATGGGGSGGNVVPLRSLLGVGI